MEDQILTALSEFHRRDLALATIQAEAGNNRRLLGVEVCKTLAQGALTHGHELTVQKWKATFGSHKMGGGVGTVNAAKIGCIVSIANVWSLDWSMTDIQPGSLLTSAETCRTKQGVGLTMVSKEVRGLKTVEDFREALKRLAGERDTVGDRVKWIENNSDKLSDEHRSRIKAALGF